MLGLSSNKELTQTKLRKGRYWLDTARLELKYFTPLVFSRTLVDNKFKDKVRTLTCCRYKRKQILKEMYLFPSKIQLKVFTKEILGICATGIYKCST